MVQSAEFFAFICIEKFSDKDNTHGQHKLGIKNVYFCVFAIATMEITTCEPINPTSNDVNFLKSGSDFAICRTSSVNSKKYNLGNRQGFNFSAMQNTLLEQDVRFSVAYYFQEQGRYLIKEFVVDHKHKEGPPNDRYDI